MRLETTIV